MSDVISGDLVRVARRRAGISQAELARRVGTPRSAIGRWERGEVAPSLERLRELVRGCGFELTLGIGVADAEEHDLGLIRATLLLSADERVERAVRAVRATHGVTP